MDSNVMVGVLGVIALVAVASAVWFYLRPIGDAIRHASTGSLRDELERRGELGSYDRILQESDRLVSVVRQAEYPEWGWPEGVGRRTGFDPTRPGIITISRNGVEAVNVSDNRT